MDGRRVARATENITITNCTIRRGHGGVVLGSETSGNIRNVVASNIICQGTDKGIRIKSGRGRGGLLENIRFDNWVIEDTKVGIEVTNYYTRVPDEPVSERTPIFRDIAISNVTVNRSAVAVSIEGLPEMPISGLRITDLVATAKEGLRAFNTSGLELKNVRINAAAGPAFLIRDSSQLSLDGIQTRRPQANTPVVRLDNCRKTSLRSSNTWEGTGTFLSVAPGQAKTIAMQGNDFSAVEETLDLWKNIKSSDKLGPKVVKPKAE